MTLEDLRETLFKSNNDVQRDEAAEQIAELHWQDDLSQQILLEALISDRLDSSLKLTCAESLAQIWIKHRSLNKEIYDDLEGIPLRDTIDQWLHAAGLS